MPRTPLVRDPAASTSREQGSSVPQRGGERGATAEDGPAEDAPAEPLRQQPCEASGTDLEAAPAGAPLARAWDDRNDGDGELGELGADSIGTSQARLPGVGRRPGRALLNGNALAAPLMEPESSITSRDFSKEGGVVFRMGPCSFLTSRLSCPALLKLKAFSTSRSPLRFYF